jgi:glucose/arabinose dehydrogenase
MTRRFPVFVFATVLFIALLACGNSAQATQSTQPAGSSLEGQTNTLEPTATATETPSPTTMPEVSFADPAAYTWNLVADGFEQPLLLTNAGDGNGRLFVVGQTGEIWVIENGNILAGPFLDIRTQVGSQGNEQGLLGLAFDPDYENNGNFYVNYTDLNGDTVIARFHVSGDPNVADAGSEEVLLQVHQPFPNHNGGNLVFGPDGYLYAGLGDGGSGGDPHGNGQSLDTLLGKLLRIDVNSGSPYGIPADNPFANGGGLPEIWAYGLRNPWRFSFDSATGDLYIADVGQDTWEEVDFLPARTAGGSNFGWNLFEGNHPYEGTPPDGTAFITPVAEYQHGGRCSITGGYVYRGSTLPAWQGIYFYGDYCSGEILGLLQHSDGTWESRLLYDLDMNITSFGLDENGELYVVDRSGSIYEFQAQ